MSRADPVEVDDMVLLLVPVLAQQPSEVRRADREHEGVCRQKLGREEFNLTSIQFPSAQSSSASSSTWWLVPSPQARVTSVSCSNWTSSSTRMKNDWREICIWYHKLWQRLSRLIKEFMIQGPYLPDDDRATSAEILHLKPFWLQFSHWSRSR